MLNLVGNKKKDKNFKKKLKIGWHFIQVVQDVWNISKIYVHLTGKQFGSSDELSIIKKRHKAIYMVMDLKTYYKFLTSFLKKTITNDINNTSSLQTNTAHWTPWISLYLLNIIHNL